MAKMKMDFSIKDFKQMSARQALREHNWGIELAPGSIVYHYELDGYIIAVGRAYDGIWDCDIIESGSSNATVSGQGWSAQEALENAMYQFVGVIW